MEFFRKLRGNEIKPKWEEIPVTLTPEAAILVVEKLKEQNLPLGGFGGAVTAMRLIDQVAREQLGPALESPEINPIPAGGIQYLIEEGHLDLSAPNLKRAYEEEKSRNSVK